MLLSNILAPLWLVAGVASAFQNVVYWGQNGGGTIENNDLSAYCQSNSGIDIIVLAFLYSFGQSGTIPSGTIGQSCFISTAGQGQNCDALASAIGTCHAAGVKIILSLGGAVGSYTLTSNSQAQQIGTYLWQSYGPPNNSGVQRPFGNNYVDGFDFDLENPNGQAYFPAMISTLRSAFATDSSRPYYITGAPQCPIPEPNMGAIIQNAVFDYLWVQFYNNNNYTYPCALPFNGNAPFNYDQWVSFTAGTPSKNAQIFIGVPAAPDAANGGPNGATYYITPDQLAQLWATYKSHTRIGGIMMWSAGFSDSNVINGCTYAQEAHAILTTGAPCGESGPPPPISSSTPPKTTLTTVTKTSTPTGGGSPPSTTGIAQWGQCGGQGYTGPTQCASPYTCVATGTWWSQCE